MTDQALVCRLRRIMLALGVGLGAGTIVELWLEGHTGEFVQLVPFGLSGLLIVSIVGLWCWPSSGTVRAARVVASIVILGAGYGLVEHFRQNYLFLREIHPVEPGRALLLDALTGASPALAPGLLTIGPILLLAATLEHPATRRATP